MDRHPAHPAPSHPRPGHAHSQTATATASTGLTGAGISKSSITTGSRGAGVGSTSSSTSSVRRNLFQSQLTRRPTAGSSSSASTSTSQAETVRLDSNGSTSRLSSESNSDIVIRDKDGEIHLLDPPTPPLDEMDEMILDTRQENERERKRLAEAVKQHQIDKNSVPAQPEGEFH